MELDFQPSSFMRRFIADFLDFMILVIPISIFMGSIEWSYGYLWNGIYAIYSTILPLVWGGYVIGKRILKIKIKRIDGKPLNFYHMFMRECIGKLLLPYITFGLAPIISIFMVIFRKDKRAIHDFIAGTYVSSTGIKWE